MPGLREERDAAVGEEERPGAPRVPVAAVDGAAGRARDVPPGAAEVAVVDRPLLHPGRGRRTRHVLGSTIGAIYYCLINNELFCYVVLFHVWRVVLPVHVGLLVVSQFPLMLDLSQSTLQALLHHLIAADLKRQQPIE